MQEKVKSYY